jgi:hypothetical protein
MTSNTPLTDAARKKTGETPIVSPAFVLASDCRDIELRLNECVEALETITKYTSAFSLRKAQEAITNARKPL